MFGDLELHESSIYSQNGEDGVIAAIFDRLGTTNKFFVEFGCGDAVECNTANLLEQGWTGVMMDYPGVSANPLARIHPHFITAENINWLFEKYKVPQSFDLLSIDIDGNDFWVWQRITARPRVVIIEYNASVPVTQRRTIVYDPNFLWSGTDYFGASLAALAELGRRKRYQLVYCERTGVNAFFIADEALPRGYQPPAAERLYRRPNYSFIGSCFPHDNTRTMIDPFLETGGAGVHAQPEAPRLSRTVGLHD